MVQGFKIRDRNIFLNIQSKVETLRLIFDRSIGKTAIKINIAHHFGTKMNTPSKKKKERETYLTTMILQDLRLLHIFLLHFFNILPVLFYIV